MRNSKLYRLLLGITILFSIFLFQGTTTEESCGGDDSCLDELIDTPFAYVNIYNHTGTDIVVVISESGKKDDGLMYRFQLKKGVLAKRVTIKEGSWVAIAALYMLPQPVPVKYSSRGYFTLKAGETGVYHVY